MDKDSAFNLGFNIAIFGITLIAQVLVLLKVKMSSLDASMIVISLAYVVSFLLRIFFTGSSLNVITLTAATIIWSILFFFIFEMKKLKSKLSSDTLEDFIARNKPLRIERVVLYVVYLGLGVLPEYVFYAVPPNPEVFDKVFILMGLTLASVHLYMHGQFV